MCRMGRYGQGRQAPLNAELSIRGLWRQENDSLVACALDRSASLRDH